MTRKQKIDAIRKKFGFSKTPAGKIGTISIILRNAGDDEVDEILDEMIDVIPNSMIAIAFNRLVGDNDES